MSILHIMLGAFPSPIFLIDFFSMNTLVLLLLVLVVYALVQATSRSIKVVHAHWHHLFESKPFEPTEFYNQLRNEINARGIAGASFSSITHSEGGIVSANRLYLRVKFREYMIDICAAPFAKEAFFVSWWLGDAGFTFRDVLISIPVIGKLFSRREKTFYEQDTEIMFKETIAHCVKQAIEQLAETRGVRQLNITDWKGSAIAFKNK